MAEAGAVLLALGPSSGGIRQHVAALGDGLGARGWRVEAVGPAAPAQVAYAIQRRQASFDVVHAHGLRVGWLASLPPRRRPLVVTVHNVVLDEVAGRRARLLRALERRVAGRVDAVIATSADVATRVGGTVIRPVWPEPCPGRSAAEVRASWGVDGAAPLVVTVARLHPQKGLDTLIDAAALVRERVAGLRVVIVGDGPMEQTLRNRIARAGLDGVVTLAGPSSDAAGALAAADVVAVPSIWESGPFVVPEAMTLGRAVVVTPVGFVPELVIDGETGRSVPVGDASALAGALCELLGDAGERERLGAEARARAGAWADRDELVDEVVAVYRRVLASR